GAPGARAARDGPHLGRALLQGGACRAGLGRDAERALHARAHHRGALRHGAGGARGERHAPPPPARPMTEVEDAPRELLRPRRTIAVVGLSPRPERPSHQVAQYLQRAGYRTVPVNPGHAAILGERSYPSLSAAAREHTIDIVDVFRRSEFAGAVVDEALRVRPRPQIGRASCRERVWVA